MVLKRGDDFKDFFKKVDAIPPSSYLNSSAVYMHLTSS